MIKNKDKFVHSMARLIFFAEMTSEDTNAEILEKIIAGFDDSIEGELAEAIQEKTFDMIRRYKAFEKMLHILAGDSNVDS